MTFTVEEPAPFIKIPAHVLDMNPKHVFVFIGRLCMVMDDGPSRVIEGEIVPMNTAGKVNIFGVHKELLVEQSGFHYRLGAQHHKASAEIGRVDGTVQIFVP